MHIVFHTPRVLQGQIVEISYALGYENGVWMRVHDRSDGETYYRLARWTPALERWADVDAYGGSPPPRSTRFGKKMTEKQFERIAYED